MARFEDNYDPNNKIAPAGGINDYLSSRANPQAGAQVGEAVQGVGNELRKAGDSQSQIILQQQGLANEHEATMAEMQLAVDGGKVYNKYKDLEGLAAANSKDQAVADYMSVSNKIRESISNDAARRAYDQMATRRMAFTIQDMNAYASDQTKKAYRAGRQASKNLSIERASSYDVATNPHQL